MSDEVESIQIIDDRVESVETPVTDIILEPPRGRRKPPARPRRLRRSDWSCVTFSPRRRQTGGAVARGVTGLWVNACAELLS
jgi:hypothetical protein